MQNQSNNTVNRFVDTFENLVRAERKMQPALGMKNSEVRVLLCIGSLSHDSQQVINVSQISNKLQVTSPTVTELIKSLSGKGYIERCADAKDKRVVDIKLTDKGEKFVQKVMIYYDALFSGLIERLGEEQSKELIELLDQVCLYLNETKIENE
ncbi:MarR family winged helix-turn-helix transcriptional regulator [Acetivibrio cellulolyticus]|uniref:MarR family winged helix-turn-helix transcriptional regulator n=1 Tax=Acetivibrio cellulolyticus TaxID=35830 RepID=UPI0001E2C6D9|nr:MarR family transcriptional regulator [Acetivibrio cellulolyticus]